MFTGKFKITLSISIIIIVAGVICAVAMGGLNLGLDFTGGSLTTIARSIANLPNPDYVQRNSTPAFSRDRAAWASSVLSARVMKPAFRVLAICVRWLRDRNANELTGAVILRIYWHHGVGRRA